MGVIKGDTRSLDDGSNSVICLEFLGEPGFRHLY